MKFDGGTRTATIGVLNLGWIVAPSGAFAQQSDSIPASIVACHAETDSLKRLVCYDQEVGKYVLQPRAAIHSQPLTEPPGTSPVPVLAPFTVNSAGVARTDVEKPVINAPNAPRHMTARIVGIDDVPDAMVINLDNGEVWQQVQKAPARVSWRVGDKVTIDRELAVYWMSGRDGMALKVRQK